MEVGGVGWGGCVKLHKPAREAASLLMLVVMLSLFEKPRLNSRICNQESKPFNFPPLCKKYMSYKKVYIQYKVITEQYQFRAIYDHSLPSHKNFPTSATILSQDQSQSTTR
jgi:hypothetical protein